MDLFDTHFHYDGEAPPAGFMANVRLEMDAPPQKDAGTVDRLELLAMGSDYIESCRARTFAAAVPGARCAVGVHPHEAEKYLAQKEDFSPFFSDGVMPAAVGELGLDYYYGLSARPAQLAVFEEFLRLALERKLPAVVHIRDDREREDAYADAYALLTSFANGGGRFVVHCFAGTPAWAEKFLALGGYCGFTGMITFNRAENVRETLRAVPDDRLLIETDSPYLAPVPHRGRKNHPGYLILIARAAAELRGVTTEELAKITTRNARLLFPENIRSC
ncbi:MAG: TatD family hydrolase [Lentisphaeria bacterium]|nr:TatD family hydrolase [Lentisphaeria bacterium]